LELALVGENNLLQGGEASIYFILKEQMGGNAISLLN
jgi:hypothetical protein